MHTYFTIGLYLFHFGPGFDQHGLPTENNCLWLWTHLFWEVCADWLEDYSAALIAARQKAVSAAADAPVLIITEAQACLVAREIHNRVVGEKIEKLVAQLTRKQ